MHACAPIFDASHRHGDTGCCPLNAFRLCFSLIDGVSSCLYASIYSRAEDSLFMRCARCARFGFPCLWLYGILPTPPFLRPYTPLPAPRGI